jgi:hypothetical protein
VIRLEHVMKPAEGFFDSGAHLVVLGWFHCSHWGDVRTAGMDFTAVLAVLLTSPTAKRDTR